LTSIVDKLIDSENNIKALFNSIPIPSYVWQKVGNDFILLDYNHAAEKWTHGHIKDYLGFKATTFHENRPDIIEELHRCISEKTSSSREYSYIMNCTGEDLFLSVKNYYVPPDLVIVHTEDITKRKLAENQLIESEKKYRFLFEQAPFSIVLTDFDGTVIDCNFTTEKFFGFKKEELIGRKYLEISVYPSETLELLKLRLTRLLKEDSITIGKYQISKKNGEMCWVASAASLIKIGDKSIIQAIGMDVTEQKIAEQHIKRKLKIADTISTISARFVGNVDIDSAIHDSLKELGKLCGASRAYIMLYNEDDTIIPYVYEWCVEGLKMQKDTAENLLVVNYPWSLKQYKDKGFINIQDVSKLPAEAEATRLELNNRGIDSILIFPITIKEQLYGFINFDNIIDTKEWENEDFALIRTSSEIIGSALERKWAEETLKGSHQLLAGIISSLTESICLIDKEYNIIWVNNVVKNNFGPNLTSMKCHEAFFCRNRRCKSCIAEKTFSDGKIHEYEAKIISDGKENKYWCTSSTAALNFDGQTELVVLIFRDITK